MRHIITLSLIISFFAFVGNSFAAEENEMAALRAKEAAHKCKLLKLLGESETKDEVSRKNKEDELAAMDDTTRTSWEKDCD
ncbi:MAG: hypothetical protein COV36_01180 [Alphaproteobacteria bacterium CG11_big_fil_rev_8_21_14_0_20_44_7]|nr:MAG: hypothetical protein COV36_01180 [Alphaproteobacteria bacterium CG11_big_fil_rev_8_21_14_0_20_44_7]